MEQVELEGWLRARQGDLTPPMPPPTSRDNDLLLCFRCRRDLPNGRDAFSGVLVSSSRRSPPLPNGGFSGKTQWGTPGCSSTSAGEQRRFPIWPW